MWMLDNYVSHNAFHLGSTYAKVLQKLTSRYLRNARAAPRRFKCFTALLDAAQLPDASETFLRKVSRRSASTAVPLGCQMRFLHVSRAHVSNSAHDPIRLPFVVI